jgi:hypothetical protein
MKNLFEITIKIVIMIIPIAKILKIIMFLEIIVDEKL